MLTQINDNKYTELVLLSQIRLALYICFLVSEVMEFIEKYYHLYKFTQPLQYCHHC